MKKYLFFLFLSLSLPMISPAQQAIELSAEECYNKGKAFNDQKEYSKAMEWYLTAANQGHAQAQVMLGWYYKNGYGVEANTDKALEWYLKAAKQGYADAQYRVGAIYNDKKEYTKAAKWYQKAADQDNASAQINLGALYNDGKGVPQDYKKAVEWYQKSAYQGNVYAQNNLGWMYEKGRGVPQDFVKAAEWYQRAANKDYSLAKKNLARIQEFLPKESQAQNQKESSVTTAKMMSDVDKDIPQTTQRQDKTFAIIIANEDYQKEAKVEFAKNDGEVFKDYCYKTLGLPEKNVHFVANATLNNLIGELDWLQQVCEAFGGDASVIFYYAGHGIPDENFGSAYLMPVDGNSRLIRTCFSINELYGILGKLPAKKVTVLMDACFSGAKRDGGMLASARGVAIKAKPSAPKGSMIVLSAAEGNETAYKYDKGRHGLFTYFLLKKLKESKGSVTLGELSQYIQDQVKRYSLVENGKGQTPTVQASDNLKGRWESMMF